jgi:uncharacterized protein (DUF305 family)
MKRLPIFFGIWVLVAVVTAAMAVGVVANHSEDGPTRWRAMGPMNGTAAAAGEPEYLAEMVAHHREAVAAARELARSQRPRMRALGASIVQSQTDQIEQMTAWLADWYPEQSPPVHYRPMMRDLSGLTGDRLDRTFLEDMIGHHMAAVMMSQHLLWRGAEHAAVARLAEEIRDDQHAEIIQMRRWLARWFDIDGCGPGRAWGPSTS